MCDTVIRSARALRRVAPPSPGPAQQRTFIFLHSRGRAGLDQGGSFEIRDCFSLGSDILKKNFESPAIGFEHCERNTRDRVWGELGDELGDYPRLPKGVGEGLISGFAPLPHALITN